MVGVDILIVRHDTEAEIIVDSVFYAYLYQCTKSVEVCGCVVCALSVGCPVLIQSQGGDLKIGIELKSVLWLVVQTQANRYIELEIVTLANVVACKYIVSISQTEAEIWCDCEALSGKVEAAS